MNSQYNLYSDFWTNKIDRFVFDDEVIEKPKGKDLYQLAQYRRALQNFVLITTGRNDIPVRFSTSGSKTDGKTVYISSNIKDKTFDVTCGLALHEASHILLSDFDVVKNLDLHLPKGYLEDAKSKGWREQTAKTRLQLMMNLIEDWRIDYYMFKNAPGYRGYYDALYEKYNRAKTVSMGIVSNEYRSLDYESYWFRIMNLTNKDRELDALPGLEKIYNLINFKKISRLESSLMSLTVASKIMKIILNNIDFKDEEKEYQKDNNISDDQFKDFIKALENGDVDFDMNPDPELNTDDNDNTNQNGKSEPGDQSKAPSNKPELTEAQKNRLEKQMQQMEDFLLGAVKKSNLSQKDNGAIKNIEKSGAEYVEVGGSSKTKCLVIKNFTQDFVEAGNSNLISNYRWRNRNAEESISRGFSLGKILGKKIQVRNEERHTQFNRKKNGKIDRRNLASLGYNNESVFMQNFVEKYNDAFLHMSIDASGSMSDNWDQTMTMLTAIAVALDSAANVDLVISFRSVENAGKQNVPAVLVAYDSRKDKIEKIKRLFPKIDLGGSTPEGLCFEALVKDMVPSTNGRDSYFINISDGLPMFQNNEVRYYDEFAVNHTKKQVEAMRNKGINVLSYYIDSGWGRDSAKKDFRKMYGKHDSQFINCESVVEIARSMNAKFLEK